MKLKQYEKQHLYGIRGDPKPLTLTYMSFCVALGRVHCTDCWLLLLLLLFVLLIGFRYVTNLIDLSPGRYICVNFLTFLL